MKDKLRMHSSSSDIDKCSDPSKMLFMKAEFLATQSKLALIANLINPAIYAALMWGFVSHTKLLFWYSGFLALTSLRVLHLLSWTRMRRQDPIDSAQVVRWKRLFDLGTLCAGAMWGSSIFLLENTNHEAQIVLTTVVIAGMTAAAIGTYMSSQFTACLFVFPAALPLMIHFSFMQSSISFGASAMVGLYIILMALVSGNLANQFDGKAHLHIQNLKLDRENDRLQSSSQTKSLFLASVSHEFRTPIAAINGYLELLIERTDLPEDVQRDLHFILRNGEYLSLMSNDILDITRIERGDVSLNIKATPLLQLIEDALSTARVKAGQKGVPIQFIQHADVPQTIFTDPVRLKQILINLLSNAVKFTEAGEVRIEAVVRQPGRLSFRVSDTGMGIDPEMSKNIFKPFVRGKGRLVSKQDGVGLGLALSKTLATKLGGELILLRSEVGRGSTFELTIGTESEGDQGENSRVAFLENPRLLRSKNVLVVDDDEDLREIMSRFLKHSGANVSTMSNSRAAVELALKSPFDLILMDLQMPGLDGLSACRTLRHKGYSGPLIAVTAHNSRESRKKCLKTGFDDCLGKPFHRDELLNKVLNQMA